MKRTEVDFEKRLWRIPAERMKMRDRMTCLSPGKRSPY
jgi:hypothetical protein